MRNRNVKNFGGVRLHEEKKNNYPSFHMKNQFEYMTPYSCTTKSFFHWSALQKVNKYTFWFYIIHFSEQPLNFVNNNDILYKQTGKQQINDRRSVRQMIAFSAQSLSMPYPHYVW